MIYPSEVRREMIRMYVEDKKPIRAIAARYGVSYGGVHKVLKTAKVTFRPRGVQG